MAEGQAVDHEPRPRARSKKGRRDRPIAIATRNPEWAVGFEDETWRSRLAQPSLHAWSEAGKPPRLEQHPVAKDDPDPKAISCYGLFVPELQETWLGFADGRFLERCCGKLRTAGKKVLVPVWDTAPWHASREVRAWIGAHNRDVKGSGRGVRIVGCLLPKKSPWLNPIEPKWVHGKRQVVEADGLLGAHELAERVCAAFQCPH